MDPIPRDAGVKILLPVGVDSQTLRFHKIIEALIVDEVSADDKVDSRRNLFPRLRSGIVDAVIRECAKGRHAKARQLVNGTWGLDSGAVIGDDIENDGRDLVEAESSGVGITRTNSITRLLRMVLDSIPHTGIGQ